MSGYCSAISRATRRKVPSAFRMMLAWKRRGKRISKSLKYLVDAGDSVTTVLSSVLESVLADVSGGGLSDELDGLDDAWDDLVLDAGVLTFSVFSDGDDVDVIVFGLVANDGLEKLKKENKGRKSTLHGRTLA